MGLITGLLMLGAALFTLGLWIYVHLRLAKFFKAAAILVNEEHNLPVATVVVRARSAGVNEPPADAPPMIRQSGPIPRPSSMRVPEPSPAPHPAPVLDARAPFVPPPAPPVVKSDNKASRPVLAVAAELRPAPAPRAETTPGAPSNEPKLLR